MYAKVCMCPDLAFVTDILGRFLSNLGPGHWKATKEVLCRPDQIDYFVYFNYGLRLNR
jgi:hypothetical protein